VNAVAIWSRVVLPRLIDLVMRNRAAAMERARLVPLASGVVFEIGIGSALNHPYYSPDVRALYRLDPSLALWRIGRRRSAPARCPFGTSSGPRKRCRSPIDASIPW
jgi:hypothetical protein